MRRARILKQGWRTIAAIALALLVSSSCTIFQGGAPALSEESLARAAGLLESAKTERDEGNLDQAAADVEELINNYPTFARFDEALYLAGEIAFERGDFSAAATRYSALNERFPLTPFRSTSLLHLAQSYGELKMYARSAETLLQLLDSPVDVAVREQCLAEVRALVRNHLSPKELEDLAKRFPASPVNREIALHQARGAYASGDYERAYRLLGEYIYQFPKESEASEARRLLKLTAEKRQASAQEPPGMVDPNTIGVVLPVTGTRSLYGRYFDEGVEMALDEFNRASDRGIKIAKADSKGEVVGAVRAVRKLVLEDGAVAILGSVFTVPTLAASIEANAWRVPLLSPVVSAGDMSEIGPWVFETKVPTEVEVLAIAGVAVSELLLERFAVLAPRRARADAELFGDEVTRLGAEVVAMQIYEDDATDYREQLEAIRQAAPEALFIPGSVEELLLILPQVKFYDLQVRLLGLSGWNSEKLLDYSGNDLEGAMFPLETYHGKDPQAFERFQQLLEEKNVSDVNPVTAAGYFGMRLLLDAVAAGAIDRGEIREYLDGELHGGTERRMEEASTLTILTVHSRRVREFKPVSRPAPNF